MTIIDFIKFTNFNLLQFSKFFNIPYRTVQKWGTGERTPPDYVLQLLIFYYKYYKKCLTND